MNYIESNFKVELEELPNSFPHPGIILNFDLIFFFKVDPN